MLFSVAMFPMGGWGSVCGPVADVIEEIDGAGLQYEVSGMDTVIEGEWNDVMPVIRRAEERLRAQHDRVFMVLMLDDRVGARNRLHGAVEDIQREVRRRAAH
jgi:uncharacterized protein (TIGR00106 family)